jgi:hypothetical protein
VWRTAAPFIYRLKCAMNRGFSVGLGVLKVGFVEMTEAALLLWV